jgi:hypothetical protein
MSQTTVNARDLCEKYLQQDIQRNAEKGILPTETAVARRMLARGDDLEGFYEAIYPMLNHDGITWKNLLTVVLTTGAYWSPEKIAALRAARKALEALNQEIADHALRLAEMLERRDELHNHSGFVDETHCAIYDVIDEAAAHNGHYASYLKEELAKLSGRYDLKYWPDLADCVRIIGVDARRTRVTAVNARTEAATSSSRPSKADFLRALLTAFEQIRGTGQGSIPPSFELPNAALSNLVNVLLDLPADELVGDEYIKLQRHRYRSAGTAAD